MAKRLLTEQEMELNAAKRSAKLTDLYFNTPSGMGNAPVTGVGQYFSNDSKYDEGITNFDLQRGLNAYRDEQQSDFVGLGNALLHGGVSFVAARALASPYGLAAYGAATALQAGMNYLDDNEDNDNPLAWFSDNLVTKAIGGIQDYVTKNTPVYDTTDQGIVENISPLSLKGVENIAQLAGFVAGGQYAAKDAMKTVGKGSLFYDTLLKIKGGDKALMGLTETEAAAKGAVALQDFNRLKNAQKFADGISGFSASLIGRTGETALEAYGTKQEMLDQGYSEEEASRASAFNFAANMALSLPDYIQNIKMLGTFDKYLTKGVTSYSDEAVDLFKAGEKAIGKYDKYTNLVSAFTKNAITEGGEEGIQYASNKGAQDTVKAKGDWLDFTKHMGDQFGQSFLTEEGQISWILGALAGGVGAGLHVRGKSGRDQADLDTIHSEALKLKNELNTNYVVNDNKIYKTIELPNGEKQNVINQDYINTIDNNGVLENIKEYAASKKDDNLFEIAKNKQILNQALFNLSIDNFDNFRTTLETSQRLDPDELKAAKALQLNQKISETTLDNSDIDSHRQSITNALELVDNFKTVYDTMKQLPQFKNTSKPAMFKLGNIITAQKAVQTQLDKFNPLVKAENPEDIQFSTDPIQQAKEKNDATQYQELKKANEELLAEYSKYVSQPALLEQEVAQEESDNVKSQIIAADEEATKTDETLSAIQHEIEQADEDGEAISSQDFELVTPSGEIFNIHDTPNGTVFTDKDNNDVTKNFWNDHPEIEWRRKGSTELKSKLTEDVEVVDTADAKEIDPKVKVKDENFKYQKNNVFSTAGRSSMPEGEFNEKGDRRDLKQPAGRKLYFNTLNKLANGSSNLSLKLEVVTGEFEGKTYPNPVIIAVLYNNGKEVNENGVRAYTTIHEHNYSQFSVTDEQRESLKNFREDVIKRQQEGKSSFVTVESISPGYLNIKKDLLEEPLSTLKDIPAVTSGGYKVAVSVIDDVTGNSVIDHNGQKVFVKFSGRPYLVVKSGIKDNKPVYIYKELATRKLNDVEINNIILPLIEKYLKGDRTITIAGKTVDILSYDKSVLSVLDMFGFFGKSSNVEKSMFFDKDQKTLRFGFDGQAKMFINEQNFDAAKESLRKFLQSKIKTVSNKHLQFAQNDRQIPVFKNNSWSMVKTTYLDTLLNGVPSLFSAAVYHNINSADGEDIFLNRYATFNPKITDTPNTKVKSSVETNPKPIEPKKPVETEAKPVKSNKLNAFEFLFLSEAKKVELMDEGIFPPAVPAHLKDIYKAGQNMTKQEFIKMVGEKYPKEANEIMSLLGEEPLFNIKPIVTETKPEEQVESIADKKANVKGTLAQQGTSIELEIKGDTGKEFLLTVDRKGNISLFSEKQLDGSYKSGEPASKEDIIKLYKKYVPTNTIVKIQQWLASFTGSWAAPETQDGKNYTKAESELNAELAALEPTKTSTAVKEEPAEDYISDNPEDLFKKATNLPYKVGDIESAKQWIQNKLGVTPDVATGLIKIAGYKDSFFGHFKKGAITLSDILEEGTEYHEAFHLVSQMYLTKSERESLYDEVRKLKGKMTDLQAEEYLAEKFRDYVMSQGKEEFPPVQKNIFSRLWNFIKGLIGLNTASVNDVFAKINAGYYNHERYINRLGEGSRDLTLFRKFETTPSETIKIQNALLAYFRMFVREKNVKFSDVDVKLSMPEFTEFVKDKFKDYNSPFNVDPDTFIKDFKNKTLKDLGFEFDQDEESSDNSSRNRSENYAESNRISGFAGMSERIQFMFNTFIDVTAPLTDYGHKPIVPINEVKSYLSNLVHDTFDVDEMTDKIKEEITRLKDLQDKETSLGYPVNQFNLRNRNILIQLGNSMGKHTADYNSVQLYNELYDALALVHQPLYLQLYYGNGDVAVNNSMEQNIKLKMKEKWNSAVLGSDFVENVNGQRFIRDFNELLRLSPVEFIKRTGINIKSTLDSDLQRKIEVFKDAISKLPKKQVIINGEPLMVTTPYWFELEDAVSKNKDFKFAPWRKSLNEIIEKDIDNYSSLIESQIRNSEGESVWAYTKPSFLFQRADKIVKGLAKTISAKNSKLWDSIANGSTTVGILIDGQRFNETNSKGQHVSTLTEEELLLNRINGAFSKLNKGKKESVINMLQMADKKSVLGMLIKDMSLICLPSDTTISDGKVEIPTRFVNRLWDIYQNYKEFDAEKDIHDRFEISKASTLFEELNGNKPIANKEDFETIMSKYIHEAMLDLKGISKNFSKLQTNIVNDDILNPVKGDLDRVLAALTLTEFVTNLEQMNIFFGNPGLYKDLFKRTPAIRANGRIPAVDSTTNEYLANTRESIYGEYAKNLPSNPSNFKAAVSKDVKVKSYYDELYKEMGVKGYDKINATDAQGLITFPFYREYMIRTSQWNDKLEKAFYQEMKGISTDMTWPPLKLVHFGPEVNYPKEMINVYYKMAVYPVIPSMAKGRKLEEVYTNMLESGVSMMVFESGNKVGGLKTKNDFYSKLDDKGTHLLDVSDLKIQVDISPKKGKWDILLGTQIRKLIMQNSADAGKDFADKESYDKFVEKISELANIELESLAEELDVTSENLKKGNLNSNSWRKLIDVVKQYAIDNEESDNTVLSLTYLQSDALTIDLLPTRDTVQNLMNSIINNRILKQKMFGRSYVQVSSVGFEYASEESLEDAVKKGMILKDSEFYRNHFVNGKFDSSHARLGFLNLVDKKVQVAEILLPYWFKEQHNINDLDANLLESLGYRIPTQGLNSMAVFKVVGFLPASADQIAAVPYEITMQSGSDFDVDKLNVFLKSIMKDKTRKETIQDEILDLMVNRLKSPERFLDYVTPNSADNLKDQAEKINSIQTKDYKMTVDYKGLKQFWTSTGIKVGKNLWSAKAGVGQAASQGTFTALTQVSPIVQSRYSKRLYAPFNKNANGDIIFGKINNVDGKPIMDLISNQHLSANVDAAKEPFIFQLNANGATNDTHYYLESAGVPDSWVNLFMTQPIIYDYVKKMAENKGLVSKLRKIKFKEYLTKDEIIDEIRSKYKGDKTLSEYRHGKRDNDGFVIPTSDDKNRNYTEEQLQEFIKNPTKYSQEQLNILDDYLFYNEWATDRRKNVSGVKFDTEGAGKNLPEGMIANYKYNKLEKSIFGGIYDLVNSTILKPFKDNVLDMSLNLYEPTILVHQQQETRYALIEAMDILNSNQQLKPENLYKVYGLLTNTILQNNLPDKINWYNSNILGDNSIAKKISRLIKSDEMKNNYLFDNLFVVDFGRNDREMDTIKFDNTVRIDSTLEAVINEAFRDFKFKQPFLYKDLIKLSLFQTGVIQSPTSFYKYIPVEDFVEISKDLMKNIEVSEPLILKNLAQNLPTLPGLVQKVNSKDIAIGREGLPETLEVYQSDKYIKNPYITKTLYNGEIALYEFAGEKDKTYVFNKIEIKGNSKFYNAIVNSLSQVAPDNANIDNGLEEGWEDAIEYQEPTPIPLPMSTTEINFQEEPSSGYKERTIKNASADATIALAIDFTSAGEKLTKSSVLNQGKKYVARNLDEMFSSIDPFDLNKGYELNDKFIFQMAEGIVMDLNSVNAKTLNIAGNGIYTMKGKYSQQLLDQAVEKLLEYIVYSDNLKNKIVSIRTGGQTGIDEAGAKASIKLSIPTTILAPKGWKFRNINGQDITNEKQFKARFAQPELPNVGETDLQCYKIK